MSRFYQVKPGDTLNSIAFRMYGNGSQSSVIQAANPVITNPNILNTAWLLTIPDVLETPQPSTPLVGGDKDEVSLVVEGKQFYLWESVDITLAMDSMASFSFTLPFDPFNDELKETFTPYQYKEVVVSIGGKKIIKGTMLDISPDEAPNSGKITVSGYSKPGILQEINLPPGANTYPLTRYDNDLKQLANWVCQPFGLTATFDAAQGAAFKKVALGPDQTLFSFLVKLAQDRGLIITSNAKGELVFQKANDDKAKTTLLEGVSPWTDSNSGYNGATLFSDYVALGDGWQKGKSSSAKYNDSNVKFARPHVFKTTGLSKGELQAAAEAKAGRAVASSQNLSINMTGWRDPDGDLWLPNVRHVVNSPTNFIYNDTEFLIRSVKLSKKANSLTSALVMVLPQAYGGLVRASRLPWA